MESVTNVVDIPAECRELVEDLYISEERFRLALRNSPITLFSQDRDFRYTWVFNPGSFRVSQEIVGKTDYEVFSHDDAERLTLLKRQVLDTGNPAREEITITLRDETKYYDLSIEPLGNTSGELIGITCAFLDITERKRTESALRESEERYRIVSDLVSDYAYSFTIEVDSSYLHLEWITGAIEQITGYTPEEANKFGDFSRLIYEGDRTIYEEQERRLIAGENLDYEHRILTKSGEIRWVHDYSHSIRKEEGGRVIRAVGATSDITERKRAEEKANELTKHLESQSARLAASNKELEAFSYSISHDLRAPLRSLDGFSLILIEDYANYLDEEGRNYLHRIRAATQRMAQLIDDILTISRAVSAEMHITRLDLGALARSVIDELQQADPERKVETTVQENISVEGDERLLRQALENLIGNAWKFTVHREDARIEFGEKQENGRRIFYVRDNGAGFDKRRAEDLFIPFRRFHSEKEFPGTGIGLSIVKRYIERHNGEIWAESEPGKGATFYFTLGDKPLLAE